MTGTSQDPEARIAELESRLALADQSILELSNEVYRQQQQLGQLESRLRQLNEQLKELETAPTANNPAGEVPPHY